MDKYEKILQQEALLNRLTCTNARELADNVRLIQETNLGHLVEDSTINRLMQNEGLYFNSAASVAEAMKSNHNLNGIQKMIQNAMQINSAVSAAEVMRSCFGINAILQDAMVKNSLWKELSIASKTMRTIYGYPKWNSIVEETQKMSKMVEAFGIKAIAEQLERQSILEETIRLTTRDGRLMEESTRRSMEGMNFSSQMTEMFNTSFGAIKYGKTFKISDLDALSSITRRLYEQPDLLEELRRAVELQVKTIERECYEPNCECKDEFTEDEIKEFMNAVDSPNIVEKIQLFVAEYGERGKRLLIKFWTDVISMALAGYIAYCCTPVYKILVPSILLEEAGESKVVTEIPANTQINLWSEVNNDYVSVTYDLDGKEFSGYITRKDLENNAVKVSNEVKWEHIVFIDEIVKLFADKWSVTPENVYAFLKEDTNLLDTYLLEHYDVLIKLDDNQRLNIFEKHCKEHGIDIQKYFVEKTQEEKAITLDSIRSIK